MDDFIQSCLSFLTDSIYFNVITLLLAILGIVVSVYFALKSRKKKEPKHLFRTISLIKSNITTIKHLNVQYKGKEISNLSVTKIALWNNGRDTILDKDIAPKSPIQIAINDEYNILACDIIYQKNESNGFNLKLDTNKKSVIITFDYIDYLDGVVIQIYHTGNHSSDLEIKGYVMSHGELIRDKRHFSLLHDILIRFTRTIDIKIHRKIMGYTTIIMGCILFIIGVLSCINSEVVEEYLLLPSDNPSWIIFAIIMIIISIAYFHLGYTIIKRNVPKGFDIFNDEF